GRRSLRPCCFSVPVPPTTSRHSLSLHDALPIFQSLGFLLGVAVTVAVCRMAALIYDWQAHLQPWPADPANERFVHRNAQLLGLIDRKSTRLNSSHVSISYAVFCLKKKNATTPEV